MWGVMPSLIVDRCVPDKCLILGGHQTGGPTEGTTAGALSNPCPELSIGIHVLF